MPPLLKDKFAKDVKQTTMDGGGSPTPPATAPTIQQIQQSVQGAQNINAAIDKAVAQNEAALVAGTGLTPNTVPVPATAPTIQQAVHGAQNTAKDVENIALQQAAGNQPPSTLPGDTGGPSNTGGGDVQSPVTLPDSVDGNGQPPVNLPGSDVAPTTPTTHTTTTTQTTPATTTTPVASSVPTTLPSANDLTSSLKGTMSDWRDAVNKQQQAKIDYAVQQAVAELARAKVDADAQFKEQAEAVALDERQGMDNAALYAEARGDKGGIGMAQYNEIQAAAAQNRLSVQQAQTKLSTDTARQIADLRAKGEFDKADALLEVSQTYLTQLMQLEQWAAEYGLSAEKFNQSLDQWQKEYDLAVDKFTESKNQYSQQNVIEFGKAMLNAGIPVDDATLKAMNMTREQADAWMLAAQMGATQTSTGELGSFANLTEMYNALRQAGVNTEAGVIAQLRSWGVNYPGDFAEAYLDWYDSQGGDASMVTGGGLYAETYAALDGYKAQGYTDEQMWLVIDSLPISDEEKEILVKHYGVE